MSAMGTPLMKCSHAVTLGILLIGTLLPGKASAQASVVDSTTRVTVSGFVDTYYSFNLARPQSRLNRLTNFDLAENQFVLSAAEIDVARAASPLGFRLEVATGSAPDQINAGSETARIFQQAYLTLVVPVGAGLTIDAGKFFTHMGYETVKAKDNFNYSRSLLFAWPIPYYHTGVRASYPIASSLTGALFFSNGWNGSAVNSGKTFGASVALAPAPPLSVVLNWLGGPAQPDSVTLNFRHVFEALATVRISEEVTLGCDGVYGTEPLPGGTVRWGGAALYARYAFAGTSALSMRGEVYSDPDGASTGLSQDLKEITVTYERVVFGSLILRGEYRYDVSSASPFDGGDGVGTRKDQSRAALACIVAF